MSGPENNPPPAQWPNKPPFNPVIDAFTKVLTRAAREKGFRQRLTASCDSAKHAVAESANMNIPENVTIVFYEGETISPPLDTITEESADTPNPDSRQNERVHVFVLPPLDENNQTTEYEYRDHLMCCYQYWRD